MKCDELQIVINLIAEGILSDVTSLILQKKQTKPPKLTVFCLDLPIYHKPTSMIPDSWLKLQLSKD